MTFLNAKQEPVKYSLVVKGRELYSHKFKKKVEEFLINESNLTQEDIGLAQIVPVYHDGKNLLLG